MTQSQQQKAAEALGRHDAVLMDGPEGLDAWLAANHGSTRGVLAVTGRSGDPRYVSREAMLDALTAWGWIDGRRWVHPSDPALTMQLIAPRDPAKPWSESYKARTGRLEADGRLRPPGRAAIEAGRAAGGWDEFEAIDALEVPGDLAEALGGSRADWDALPPSYRRNVLRWIHSAKRPPTRAGRIAKTAASVADGTRIPQM